MGCETVLESNAKAADQRCESEDESCQSSSPSLARLLGYFACFFCFVTAASALRPEQD